MGLISEFKTFAVKGNAMDLAVGVILGAAFGRIVSSLVEDVIMPPIGRIVGNLDFSNLYVSLSANVDAKNQSLAATRPADGFGVTQFFDTATRIPLAEARKIGPVLAYGNFLTILLNFIIVSFCVFMLVKALNRLKRKEAAAPSTPPAPTTEEKLLTEIRDLLARGPAGR